MKESHLYSGSKVELAGQVAAALRGLDQEQLRVELGLLQPPWLSLSVSRQMVDSLTPAGGRVDSLTCLLGRLELGGPVESLAYSLVACCHLHTLTSGAWHLELQGQGLATWRAMERLQEGEGRGHRTVRWRSEVSVPRAWLLEEVNRLLAASSQQEEVGEGGGSGLKALVFKMSSPTDF